MRTNEQKKGYKEFMRNMILVQADYEFMSQVMNDTTLLPTTITEK